ncbi:TLR4 regulator and MIR-interacting MSAP domain-containing protein [Ditylenchus destructor]|uniref:TLR4 regulator and MIR-interacting MSAP domain-containing protein n=1 Tax=Ditylenchus destructor TaxID=166010 RepID=A0AAD4RDK7_9BILA|nr:TLR4 regulator and MIR-interacting MSAP domain-containing protein [Ditylenchus destructor]
MNFGAFLYLYANLCLCFFDTLKDLDEGDKYMPTKCEACQLFATELENSVARLPKMPLREAEAWLAEELEEICRGMLSYKVHRDIPGVGRFKKETTRLASIFKDMGAQGVEIKMNHPNDPSIDFGSMLDQPTLESDQLKLYCEWMLEEFEPDIDHWFLKTRKNKTLQKYLCEEKVGRHFDSSCLPRDSPDEL